MFPSVLHHILSDSVPVFNVLSRFQSLAQHVSPWFKMNMEHNRDMTKGPVFQVL